MRSWYLGRTILTFHSVVKLFHGTFEKFLFFYLKLRKSDDIANKRNTFRFKIKKSIDKETKYDEIYFLWFYNVKNYEMKNLETHRYITYHLIFWNAWETAKSDILHIYEMSMGKWQGYHDFLSDFWVPMLYIPIFQKKKKKKKKNDVGLFYFINGSPIYYDSLCIKIISFISGQRTSTWCNVSMCFISGRVDRFH